MIVSNHGKVGIGTLTCGNYIKCTLPAGLLETIRVFFSKAKNNMEWKLYKYHDRPTGMGKKKDGFRYGIYFCRDSWIIHFVDRFQCFRGF